MTVKELITCLQQMPQDILIDIEIGDTYQDIEPHMIYLDPINEQFSAVHISVT